MSNGGDIRLGITIRADGSAQVSGELNRIRSDLNNTGTAAQGAGRQFADMARTFGTIGGIIAGLGIAKLAKDVLDINREFQTLRTSLVTTTGSLKNAATAFGFIQDFAAKTPFDVEQLTTAFIRLGNLGLKPSEVALRSYGNTAASQGKSIMQMIEAVADATTGEFERLKEFGIKAKDNGDTISFVFQGVTTVVKDSAQDIEGYLINLGNTKFGDAMANQAKTIDGALSNLGDAWDAFIDNILNDVNENLIGQFVTNAANAIHWLDVQLNGAIRSADKLAEIDNKIAANRAALDAHSSNGMIGSLVDDLTGFDETLKRNQIDSYVKEREKLVKTITEEKAGQEALINSMSKSVVASNESAKATSSHAAAHRSASPHIAAHKVVVDELARAYDQEMKALQDKNAMLSQSPRDYEKTRLAAKGLTDEMIEQAMRIYDVNTAWEKKKETEDKQKSEMDALIDKYNQLTLSARDYYRTKLEGEGIKGAAQEPLLAQYDKNNQIEASQKAIDDSRASLQAWIDDVGSANESMRGLGATTTSVFQGALGGLNAMAGAVDTMIANLQNNQTALEALAKRKKEYEAIKPDRNKSSYMVDLKTEYDAKKKYETEYSNLQAKTVNDYIDGINTMVGAAASMYQDNQAAQIAAQSIMLVTLGIQAALAVAHQASDGDVYTAFARMAAMAASVGALVASVGGSSGSVSIPPTPPNSADTGTVLGDKAAQSESINNVYDLLKSIHADEYAELRGINKGVAALSGGILGAVTKTFQTGAITGTNAPHLGESKYTMVSGGLATASVVLADILGGIADFAGQMYTTEQHLGGSKKKPTFSFQDYFTPMADSVTESLKGMFYGIGSTMKSVSDQLGKDIGQDLNTKLNAAIIPALKIDILGLSGEDAVKKVNAVISTAMDTVATQVFGGIISEYQKLGEGMLETAVRIVSEMAVVKDALAQSGLSMSGNAIDLADSLVQAAGGLEQFQQQFEGFYDAFFTDIDKQNRLQTRLNETFAEVYMLLPRTREEYRKVLGALNLNNEADRERYSLMLQLSSAADSYYSMIEDKSKSSSELNAARVNQEIELMRLQGNAAGALALERRRELEAMDESLRAMQRLIYTYSDLSGTLTTAYNNAADLLTQTFTKFFNLAKSLVQYRDALKVGDLSTGSPESKYKANKAEFERIKAIIAGGKGTTELSELRFRNALESLQSVSDKFLTSSRDYNASGKGYAADYQSVITTLTQGSSKSLNIASTAERQLNALNDMVSGLTTLNLSVIKLDGSIGKVDGSVDDVGARVRVSNEQLRDVNGSIKTGNTWLGKVDTKTDKVSGQLTSANVWIREGNKWLRLVDGSTGRVNERLKDSNLWIKEGNHYLSLVDKKTGKVNDKLINVDGSVKKVYHSTGNIGAAVRVSNEQLRDVNGSIKTGNTWLGKVDTKTDKVSGQLTSANVWIREGNKWLRLVDGSTGRVNERLKDSNLWIKEGNHYLSLVDKKTGLVNDKLINVDGSVKKVYQSTDKAPSATDLVRQAINGTGGLKDATKDVKKSVKELNSKDGLSGAIGGVKSAVGSVRDAVKGMTAAIIAINKLQADRDKAAAAAAKAEAQAAAQRAREQAALDKAARDKAAAALYQQKQQAYGAIVGKTDWNAMKWLAKNAGFDEATSSTYASSWAPWAKSLIGDFDPNKTLAQYSQLSTLMDSFRKFLEASALGRGFPVDAAFFSRRAGEINGSHANGLDFVPFDGYRAELHKGERVLTAAEVRNSDKASKETIKICNEILAELKAANKQRGAVAVETLKKVDKLVEKTDAQTRAVRRIST